MRNIAVFSMLLAASVAGSGAIAASMDPVDVGPDVYKKVFENEKVRVFEVTFKPGGKIGMHSHPDHFAYAITDGSLKITNESGKTMDANVKAGDVMWINAESHKAENAGAGEVKLLVTELKGSKTKAKKAPAKPATK
ncbi:MAG: cupin domain-containing protein [Elusimicrobia bacterium]|nr:cupin domain-containing protein [Elusimicrobiota bacterium]